jgi:hypothetical protein
MERRIHLFSPQWEAAVLLVGVLPFLAIIFKWDFISNEVERRIVGDLLFLNVVHNGFTFYVMWRSGELRRALQAILGSRKWLLYVNCSLVFFGVVASFFYLQGSDFVGENFLPTLLLTASLFFPLQHSLSQQMGLSKLYDQNLRAHIKAQSSNPQNFESELNRLSYFSKLDLYLHRVMLLGIAIICAFRVIPQINSLLQGRIYLFKYIILFAGLGIIILSALRPRAKQSNQAIFNLRRSAMALSFFFEKSFLFLALQNLVHGFEYLAVTAQVERKAAKGPSFFRRILVFVAITGIVTFLLIQRIIERSKGTLWQDFNYGPMTTTFSAISVGITFTHYYLDSVLYRFSNPELRSEFLPVLLEPAPPSGSC